MAVRQVSHEIIEKNKKEGKQGLLEARDEFMPKWDSMKEALKGGSARAEEVLDFADEARQGHDSIIYVIAQSSFAHGVTHLAKKYGEEHVEGYWRKITGYQVEEFVKQGYTAEELVLLDAEEQRLLQVSDGLKVVEEEDRFVVTAPGMGMAGRIKRDGIPVGTTTKPWPWSWGEVGVPFSYVEQAIRWEILPIELIGHPLRITIPGKTKGEPDTHIFYKDPAKIPEEYYRRVGKEKKPFDV